MFHQVSWYVPHMFSYLITDVLIFPYIFGMFWLCPYISLIFHDVFFMFASWIDWFNGTFTRKSHISWENLWFPVDFPLSQPIDRGSTSSAGSQHGWGRQAQHQGRGLENPASRWAGRQRGGLWIHFVRDFLRDFSRENHRKMMNNDALMGFEWIWWWF